jgi:hypothetical protein
MSHSIRLLALVFDSSGTLIGCSFFSAGRFSAWLCSVHPVKTGNARVFHTMQPVTVTLRRSTQSHKANGLPCVFFPLACLSSLPWRTPCQHPRWGMAFLLHQRNRPRPVLQCGLRQGTHVWWRHHPLRHQRPVGHCILPRTLLQHTW